MFINTVIKKEYAKYALKGALAALLALIIAYVFDILQSYWVLFGAVTVSKLHVGASFHRGKQRVFGTLLGVAISLLLALCLLHWPLGIALLIPLCIFAAVYYLPYYSVSMIFITILFVLTFGVISHHPVYYGMARIFDTLLGVALAMTVSLCLWPNRISKVLEREFQGYFSQVILLFSKFSYAFINESITVEEKNKELKVLDEAFLKLKEGVVLIGHEPGKKPNFYKQEGNILLQFDRLYSVINTLGSLATENMRIVAGGALHQHLLIFIEKAQRLLCESKLTRNSQKMHENEISTTVFSEEIQELIQNLQYATKEVEQKLQWTIDAFIQIVCDVVYEMQRAHQASQNFR